MDLNLNIFKSETSCTESNLGYSLKKKNLNKWIFENGLSFTYVANILKLPCKLLAQNLAGHIKFTREQLDLLIKLMGAKEAFKVIYFPSGEDRTKIFYEVFVEPLKKELGIK